MLPASLFRLPVITTFIKSAVLGMVLALVTNYYHSLPDVDPSDSASYSVHKHNDSSSIASELWHSHTVVCVHLLVYLTNRISVEINYSMCDKAKYDGRLLGRIKTLILFFAFVDYSTRRSYVIIFYGVTVV